MIGLILFFATLFLTLFLIFFKFSFYLSFVLDIAIIGVLGGYGSYLYIVPLISSGEAKWFWIILFAVLAIIIYLIIYIVLVKLCGVVGIVFNFVVSVLSSAVFCIVMKSLFDSLYRDFVLETKNPDFHFTLFKNPNFDYIIYVIVILVFGYFIHTIRMTFIEDTLIG